MGDMTPTLLLAVPCPTCGATGGKRCLLDSGRVRDQPHLDRRLCAIEAVEEKRTPRPGAQSTVDRMVKQFEIGR